MDSIHVKGAAEHNLKGIDVEIPRDQLTVVTGLSGSGKSSLAFDTIYQEGQRRFMESLSAYARQFLGSMEKPRVERVDGLSPTLSIDQKTVNRNPRSTVGTVTEIFDHQRLLMARLGTPRCPICKKPIQSLSPGQIADRLIEDSLGARLHVMAPVVQERKGEYRKELKEALGKGFIRARIDGEVRSLEEGEISLARYEKHTIELVLDRLKCTPEERSRLVEAIETALPMAAGVVTVLVSPAGGGEDVHRTFSSNRSCVDHDIAIPEMEPRLFSFNAPQGMCTACSGIGWIEDFDLELLIDREAKVLDALVPLRVDGRIPFSSLSRDSLGQVIQKLGISAKTLWKDLGASDQDKLLNGAKVRYEVVRERETRSSRSIRTWSGILPIVRYVWQFGHLNRLAACRRRVHCETCQGQRLNPIALAVDFRGRNISDLTAMTVVDAGAFFGALALSEEEARIGAPIVKEIIGRLRFLEQVGLGYLTLDRSAATLSGGEAQRIRLAAQVGAGLQGVTYVLDEPSIGLHARDHERLLDALCVLRDKGNTVIVVEHDPATMARADFLVEIGPGAGREGGELVCAATPAKFLRNGGLTARYLRGEERIPTPATRRPGNGKHLIIAGARENNLKGVTLDLPLGTLIAVTGVSGSGKSTLVVDTLHKALAMALQGSTVSPGAHDRIVGIDAIDKVIEIDQAPIGRTPRSNPATYTGVFDPVRSLFAQLTLSQERGYKPGQFSFNVAGGRCEECQGAGVQVIEMQFLADVEVPCESCHGRRFHPETLEVRYRGRNVAEILDMTIGEATEFFKNQRKIHRILETMDSVGLGYVSLGQPSTTLSGGEAQRVKLATELHKPSTGRTLYILDEPTTGLHMADVRRLLDALGRLVDAGNTVVVIEHNADVIKVADHVVDLGPEGGKAGGEIIGAGTPEQVAQLDTPTGAMLREALSVQPLVVAEPTRRPSKPKHRAIRMQGVTTHNLKSIDVEIPHGKTTVITGVSGSGKTSLAFHTLFSEGQRRYVESLSTYARRFLGRLDRAPVEHVDGLAPAIAIDQRNRGHNPRSTVATVTEIYDSLRLLYARIGRPHCPTCRRRLIPLSPSAGARHLRAEVSDPGMLLAQLPPGTVAGDLLKEGYVRVLDATGIHELADESEAFTDAWLVVDRFHPARTEIDRMSEAISAAYRYGGDRAVFRSGENGTSEDVVLTHGAICPVHGAVLPEELTPRHFSFNSHWGACLVCDGIGRTMTIDVDLLIPDPHEPLERAIDPRVAAVVLRSPRSRAILEAVLAMHDATIDTPPAKWSRSCRRAVLRGLADPVTVTYERSWGSNRTKIKEERPWVGLVPSVESWRGAGAWLLREAACPECDGGRLRPEFLAVTLGGAEKSRKSSDGKNIAEICAMTVDDSLLFWRSIELSKHDRTIAHQVLQELDSKLGFLHDVGLGYLTLDRAAETLSGGEAQRIRLATQLGSRLTGVIYVLDEPTIGLHPRDTARLLGTLEGLRDLGNTLVLVEHDEDVIRSADHVIDIGPGAGENGGRIVATGTPAEVAAGDSLTGLYLRREKRVPAPVSRRTPDEWITLPKSRLHNLKNVSIELPRKALTVVSGVSGSGKSTAILEVARPHLEARRDLRVVTVDQLPIGRTPRSIPASYTGILDPIRALFAETALARERGYDAGRFSFNHHTGRCPQCEGRGATLIEMHFLSDVWIPCEACAGRRYNRETLEVRWKGLTIADVLDLRIEEALEVFRHQKGIARRLQAMQDVGLGYVRLGQPATTLSGGEAQRLKLAVELVSRQEETCYLLDEPTTGLHLADIEKLMGVLHRLVDAGHMVVVIEHHLDVIWNADHVIEMGPEGGHAGGKVVATCDPVTLAAKADTWTGRALAERFGKPRRGKKKDAAREARPEP